MRQSFLFSTVCLSVGRAVSHIMAGRQAAFPISHSEAQTNAKAFLSLLPLINSLANRFAQLFPSPFLFLLNNWEKAVGTVPFRSWNNSVISIYELSGITNKKRYFIIYIYYFVFIHFQILLNKVNPFLYFIHN